jgi:hypothetical protein
MCISDNFGMRLVTNENERPILEEHNMLQIEDWRAYPVLSQLGLWARQEHSALIQEPTGKRKKKQHAQVICKKCKSRSENKWERIKWGSKESEQGKIIAFLETFS